MAAKGVVAGLVASWVKALTEPRLQALAEAILPPSPSQKQDVGADPSGHPENMPPAVLVDRATVALGRRLTVPQRLRVQHVIHYGMGAGLAIYAGTHGFLLPALGIQRPPWRLSPAAVAWESTSHLVFGVALEAARSALGGRR